MKKTLLAISIFLLTSFPVFANGEAAAPAKAPGGSLNPILLMVGIFAIMYFLMIRPQQKKQKEKIAMLNSIQEGDKIVTIGGIYGTVKQVKDNSIRVQIDDHTRIELAKSSVANIIEKVNAPAEQPTEKK